MTDSGQQGRERAESPPFAIIDPQEFLSGGIFRQDDFLAGVNGHDWNQYRNKRVLVRGCGDMPIPPWAYMAITARLTGIARSVRYGNEHDHVVVYRAQKT